MNDGSCLNRDGRALAYDNGAGRFIVYLPALAVAPPGVAPGALILAGAGPPQAQQLAERYLKVTPNKVLVRVSATHLAGNNAGQGYFARDVVHLQETYIHPDASLRIRCPRPGPPNLVALDNQSCRFESATPGDSCVVKVQVAGRSIEVYRGCLIVSNPTEKHRNLGGSATTMNPLQRGSIARKQQKTARELPKSKVQEMVPRGEAQQKAWMSNGTLLLMLGIAGGGKSTIALMIADRMRRQQGPLERVLIVCNTNTDVRRKCAVHLACPHPSSLRYHLPLLPSITPAPPHDSPRRVGSPGAPSCARWASRRSSRRTPSRRYSC